jgi:hypothetical protein
MVRGRKAHFRNPITISLVVEYDRHEKARYLGLKESEIYNRGLDEILKERAPEMSVEHQQSEIQVKRIELKGLQEDIAWRERVLMDTEIKIEHQDRRKKEIRYDERGKEYQVVIAE